MSVNNMEHFVISLILSRFTGFALIEFRGSKKLIHNSNSNFSERVVFRIKREISNFVAGDQAATRWTASLSNAFI